MAFCSHDTIKECGVNCSQLPIEQHKSYNFSSVYPEVSLYSVIIIYFIISIA